MEEAVTPLPIPESTPPVTMMILRSASRVSVTSDSRVGGRWLRRGPRGDTMLLVLVGVELMVVGDADVK